MITINLLPDALRKKERMPFPQFAGICAIIAVIGLMMYMITKYQFDTIPTMKNKIAALQRQKTQLQAVSQELKAVRAEIGKLSEHVNAVKSLYRNRIVWSKILSDIKHIVNFDSTMMNFNPEGRYLWFSRIEGKGKNLTMNAYATAATQVEAMQMPEQLFQTFRSYKPDGYPEKNEEERLQAELKKATADWEALRRENPDLPSEGEQEAEIKVRLEEIKKIKSGGIALQPFIASIKPETLLLINATWSPAPRPSARELAAIPDYVALFPPFAWSFGISMELK